MPQVTPDVSSLVDYVIQNKLPLLTKAIFKAKTINLVSVQSGVKSAEAIEITESPDPIFQPAGAGFTASGITSFTQRIITVGRVKVQYEYDPTLLNRKYTQLYLDAGSKDDNMGTPVEAVWAEQQVQKIAANLEIAFWQGDTSSAINNLSFFDGFIKIISGCTGQSVSGNTTAVTGVTTSNATQIIDTIITNLPPQILEKPELTIFCGLDFYRTLVIALKNQNLFHFGANMGADYEMFYPTTNIKVIGVNGLNLNSRGGALPGAGTATPRLYATWAKNLYIGLDLESDYDDIDMWYSKDFQIYRLSVKFKAGTQVAFCDEIVTWTLPGFF